ncbi:hypothetical protein GDO78_003307 [Eleutherodactylus coqui]|uniref:Uncharacterized protein n=1 Tax=Eleutherodactylus coqui TaxID=57060 RepID=A0A8J6ESG1_ELECQ|nr:hypothetical protein GDO78_003307 [Eleutherodactylus coqui]
MCSEHLWERLGETLRKKPRTILEDKGLSNALSPEKESALIESSVNAQSAIPAMFTQVTFSQLPPNQTFPLVSPLRPQLRRIGPAAPPPERARSHFVGGTHCAQTLLSARWNMGNKAAMNDAGVLGTVVQRTVRPYR